MLTDQSLCAWCETALGARPAEVVLRTGHLSQVLVVLLADGRQVVVKARPFEPRLRGCAVMQRSLAAGGFPCPIPLAGPDLIDTLAVSAETFADVGMQRDVATGAEAFAALLARLVAAAPAPDVVPALAPAPPWNGWDHSGAELWPDRGDKGRNSTESTARRGSTGPRPMCSACSVTTARLPAWDTAIGRHKTSGGWDEATAVHDWDSVIAQPEVAIVGFASAVWTKQGRPDDVPTVEQSAAFIDAYERAAGVHWTHPARQAAWAAGLWVRLFDAKIEAASGGGPELDRLSGEIAQRLERAGLDA